jgi:hypothetical protein
MIDSYACTSRLRTCTAAWNDSDDWFIAIMVC